MGDAIRSGELATRCGVSNDTVRFYEREGLLGRPQRSPSGYRIYGEEDERRLRFIRQAQTNGLTLADIRKLVRQREASTPDGCRRVAVLLKERIEAIDRKLAELTAFRGQLAAGLEQAEKGVSIMRVERAAAGGAVLSGIVASACCIGPLVFGLLGISGAAFASRFEPLRPYFLVLTYGLLVGAFYFTYRPQAAACGPGEACAMPRANHVGRALLWLAAVAVVLVTAFPYYAAYLPI
jgi:MerR family Zn(II)-responsive transcriptional regulator of zntA